MPVHGRSPAGTDSYALSVGYTLLLSVDENRADNDDSIRSTLHHLLYFRVSCSEEKERKYHSDGRLSLVQWSYTPFPSVHGWQKNMESRNDSSVAPIHCLLPQEPTVASRRSSATAPLRKVFHGHDNDVKPRPQRPANLHVPY